MIIVLKKNIGNKILPIKQRIQNQGLTFEFEEGELSDLLLVKGDASKIDAEAFLAFDGVESVKRVTEPFLLASKRHKQTTIVKVGDKSIGGGQPIFIAGPCAVESYEQIISLAFSLKKAGVDILRGGAYKPRSSPYTFQGLKDEGIKLLLEAKKQTNLPICSEVTDVKALCLYDDVDVLQIGARNMQNFELLKDVAKTNKPVILKRGFSNTISEWLLSAEYLLSFGNDKVILCERGIRTFETAMRFTLDISAIPYIKSVSHLPIIVDPSHATGLKTYVTPLSLAASAAGADGVIIEVHDHPEDALSDGAQAISVKEFAKMRLNWLKINQIEK